MKEVILIGAEWCAACKAMKRWFFDIEIPGVSFRYQDAEVENISSVPAVILREDGNEVQTIYGNKSQLDLVKMIYSFWPDVRA